MHARTRLPRISSPLIAALVVAAWLLLVPTPGGVAVADTVTLTDGRVLTGTIVRQTDKAITLDLDLFRTGSNGQPERIQISIPGSRQRQVVTDRRPTDPIVLPAANATPAEKLDAARAIIRHGGDTWLHDASRLLREVADAGPGAADGPELADPLLRFRLADLVAAWQAAGADSGGSAEVRNRLLLEFTTLRTATDVIVEYAMVLALQQSLDLQIDARRNKLVDQLRRRVPEERQQFIRFVERARKAEDDNAGSFDHAAWRAELARRWGVLNALIATPGSPAALQLAPGAVPAVARLDALLQICAATASPDESGRAWHQRILAAVHEHTADWRARLPADVIAGFVDRQTSRRNGEDESLVELNAAIDGFNKSLIDDLARTVPRGRLDNEVAVFHAVNFYRATLGLRHLVFERNLYRAAGMHAETCARRRILQHEIDGSTPRTRAAAAGFRNPVVGENLCSLDDDPTPPTAGDVVAAWQLSPGHHFNLLRDHQHFESGAVSRSGRVWCMMFGGPAR